MADDQMYIDFGAKNYKDNCGPPIPKYPTPDAEINAPDVIAYRASIAPPAPSMEGDPVEPVSPPELVAPPEPVVEAQPIAVPEPEPETPVSE